MTKAMLNHLTINYMIYCNIKALLNLNYELYHIVHSYNVVKKRNYLSVALYSFVMVLGKGDTLSLSRCSI